MPIKKCYISEEIIELTNAYTEDLERTSVWKTCSRILIASKSNKKVYIDS
jgi:hypothetical protein